jgi:hypothetical protein
MADGKDRQEHPHADRKQQGKHCERDRCVVARQTDGAKHQRRIEHRPEHHAHGCVGEFGLERDSRIKLTHVGAAYHAAYESPLPEKVCRTGADIRGAEQCAVQSKAKKRRVHPRVFQFGTTRSIHAVAQAIPGDWRGPCRDVTHSKLGDEPAVHQAVRVIGLLIASQQFRLALETSRPAVADVI